MFSVSLTFAFFHNLPSTNVLFLFVVALHLNHSTEMTRLTNELESVYVDERRDALDKLQAEHIEELRALTNRYTANEEELRAEVFHKVP